MGIFKKLFGLEPASSQETPSLPGEVILLAEPSITLRKVVQSILEGEGCQVIAVARGDEAIAELRMRRPTAVIASVTLAGPSGYDLCVFMKADSGLRDIPVILSKGAFEKLDSLRAKEVGSAEVLEHPAEPRKLVEMVQRVLGR